MTEYSEYLRDKRVVLVGPSGAYTGSGKGPSINSYDVVARLNWGCPVPADRRDDLGSRTDVLYKRMLTGAQPNNTEIDSWIADGVRYVLTSDRNDRTPMYRRLQMLLRGRVDVEPLGPLRGEIIAKIGNPPLMGVLAIQHLLKQPIRSLMVANCDFYRGGYFSGYGGQEYRSGRGRREGTIGSSHDAQIQLRYLGQLRYLDPRLEFDEALSRMVRDAARAGNNADVAVVIPARYESSRFPGKPLAPINGKPMILHVCEAVADVVAHIVVATDDERIRRCVEENGYSAIMTGPALTGTDRVAEAIARLPNAKLIVNIQGDEPLVRGDDITTLIEAKRAYPHSVINGMCALEGDPYDQTVVKAAVADSGRLLYASRAPVPAVKDGTHAARWKQLGMYAFSRDELARFARLGTKGSVEQEEDVEILRFLELGMPVQMVELAGTEQAVDLPEHIAIVEDRLNVANGTALLRQRLPKGQEQGVKA